MDIREMLRCLLRAGLTEKFIARAVNVNQSTISRILSGKIRSPRMTVAIKIANIFQEKHLADQEKSQVTLS